MFSWFLSCDNVNQLLVYTYPLPTHSSNLGLPLWLVNNPLAMRETWVRSLGLRRYPGEGNGYPTPVFRPGEFHGLYSPRGRKESDTAERLSPPLPATPHFIFLDFTHKWYHLISVFLWLIPLSVIVSRSSHVAADDIISFFSYDWGVHIYIHHIFIHSPVSGYFG